MILLSCMNHNCVQESTDYISFLLLLDIGTFSVILVQVSSLRSRDERRHGDPGK